MRARSGDGELSLQRQQACQADFLLNYQRYASRISEKDHFDFFLDFDPLCLTLNPFWSPQPLSCPHSKNSGKTYIAASFLSEGRKEKRRWG